LAKVDSQTPFKLVSDETDDRNFISRLLYKDIY